MDTLNLHIRLQRSMTRVPMQRVNIFALLTRGQTRMEHVLIATLETLKVSWANWLEATVANYRGCQT